MIARLQKSFFPVQNKSAVHKRSIHIVACCYFVRDFAACYVVEINSGVRTLCTDRLWYPVEFAAVFIFKIVVEGLNKTPGCRDFYFPVQAL